MLEILLTILSEWKTVFAQDRTLATAIRQAISLLCVAGRKTITQTFLVRGLEQEPAWGDYKLYARSPWTPHDLFDPILRRVVAHSPGKLLGCAIDDVRIRKTGKKIATARMGRDPLSPPYHVNLVKGLRFVHMSLMMPLRDGSARFGTLGIPVGFEEAPPVEKPGKQASAEQVAAYKQARKEQNVSVATRQMLCQARQRVDEVGGETKVLVCALDGSLTNRTTLREPIEGVEVIGRVRKDAKLCFRHTGGGQRIYGVEKFTPDQVLTDAAIAWRRTTVVWGGKRRVVTFKQVDNVLWQGGSGQRLMRLIVVGPVPYRRKKGKPVSYRDPVFLLCTVTEGKVAPYLQISFDRWQVEVVHRELKTTFGVGEAQVRAKQAVARQPALHVAAYSALRLAALICYGAVRSQDIYGRRPRWQRERPRASCHDLVRRMGDEALGNPVLLARYGMRVTAKSILATAVR